MTGLNWTRWPTVGKKGTQHVLFTGLITLRKNNKKSKFEPRYFLNYISNFIQTQARSCYNHLTHKCPDLFLLRWMVFRICTKQNESCATTNLLPRPVEAYGHIKPGSAGAFFLYKEEVSSPQKQVKKLKRKQNYHIYVFKLQFIDWFLGF